MASIIGGGNTWDFNFGGAPRVPSQYFQGETQARSSLYWLYLAMTMLERCFGNSDFLHGENLRSSTRQHQQVCIVSFFEALNLEILFYSRVLSAVVVRVLFLRVIVHRGVVFFPLLFSFLNVCILNVFRYLIGS
jgi:hypothetical protein